MAAAHPDRKPSPKPQRAPTIAEALEAKLGRPATHAELCEEVRRILRELPPTPRRPRG